jgi:acetyl-CoA carboxylase carboxyltransferase component
VKDEAEAVAVARQYLSYFQGSTHGWTCADPRALRHAVPAGGFDAPVFTVAWPTGEFGAMGLEGAVRLGFRKELEAAAEGPQRDALFKKLVAQQYANGEAIPMAQTLEIDAVIDPADTRAWLVRGLASAVASKREPAAYVDTW